MLLLVDKTRERERYFLYICSREVGTSLFVVVIILVAIAFISFGHIRPTNYDDDDDNEDGNDIIMHVYFIYSD